jgi:hypothetical protein
MLRTKDGHAMRTKEGHAMKYASMLLAVLLVAGSFGTPMLYADGGGDYSEPPAVEDGTVILADGGGDLGGQPVDEQTGEILMVDGGGDHSGQPVEEAHDITLV